MKVDKEAARQKTLAVRAWLLEALLIAQTHVTRPEHRKRLGIGALAAKKRARASAKEKHKSGEREAE